MADTIAELRRTRLQRPRVRVFLCVAALLLVGCGGTRTPEVGPGGAADGSQTDGSETPGGEAALAPECEDVDRLTPTLPEGGEPTGTTAEPRRDAAMPDDQPDDDPDGGADDAATAAPPATSLAPEIEAWGQQEAPDTFAGVWLDQDVGGVAVAFADDVERHATEVRERFHPGLAVAEADHSYAELRRIQDRLTQEMGEEAGPGVVTSTGVHVMINRTTVGIVAPDEERLAELSEAYGASAICFQISPAPAPPGEGLETLAKASGWRDGLEQSESAFAVLEIAYDREAAERAWRDNVPEDLGRRDDELPAEPGVYGDLGQVDFDRQAVVVWSSGESGSCPEWLTAIDTRQGTISIELDATAETCTSDYNPYRVVAAVDRDRIPARGDLPSARLDGVPDGEVRTYPGGEE